MSEIVTRPRSSELRRTGWATALVVAVLAPIVFATTTIKSVTLSPNPVVSGGTVTGSVTFDVLEGASAVRLSSSNASVATVPSSITATFKKGFPITGNTFPVTTVAGAAGCATISAQVATGAPLSTLLFVQPATSSSDVVQLHLAAGSVTGGQSTTGSLFVTQPISSLQLGSSNASATVPASVTMNPNEMGVAVGNFTVNTVRVSTTGCAVITATLGSSKGRALLKITPLFVG